MNQISPNKLDKQLRTAVRNGLNSEVRPTRKGNKAIDNNVRRAIERHYDHIATNDTNLDTALDSFTKLGVRIKDNALKADRKRFSARDVTMAREEGQLVYVAEQPPAG